MSSTSDALSVALVSGRSTSSIDGGGRDLQTQRQERSHLLWSLRRFGVRRVITPPEELSHFQEAQRKLSVPPPLPPNLSSVALLSDLYRIEQQRSLINPLHEIGGPAQLKLSPPPSAPLPLRDLMICFHDELIGVRDALLVHYGAERFEVSGYHSPISSVSVPLGVELSALIITRLDLARASAEEPSRELVTAI